MSIPIGKGEGQVHILMLGYGSGSLERGGPISYVDTCTYHGGGEGEAEARGAFPWNPIFA